jgi:hypothetical protein
MIDQKSLTRKTESLIVFLNGETLLGEEFRKCGSNIIQNWISSLS